MDVNRDDWSQRDFIKMANECDLKDGWMCERTQVACKDYLCPLVVKAKDIAEVRSNFAQHAKA